MKITTLLGSPRKKGNTAQALSWYEEEINALGHNIDRVNIVDLKVNGCLGCGKCEGAKDEPGCVQKDDVMEIFNGMMRADAVVYASPLYCWGFSAQMKALIDRHFCLVKGYGTPEYTSLVDGKPTGLLVTCAGPIENNADLIQVLFDRINAFGRSKVVGKYVLPFCTTPEALGQEARKTVKKMAQDMTGL
jgi:multimeric flavodoxin WrbA